MYVQILVALRQLNQLIFNEDIIGWKNKITLSENAHRHIILLHMVAFWEITNEKIPAYISVRLKTKMLLKA